MVPASIHLRKSQRLPREQVYATAGADITVSDPGKATIFVRYPRLLRPPARNEGTRTQDFDGIGVSFKCYGADVTVPSGSNAVCDGS